MKKTAAVCVAKLYDISPELVRDQGFIDTLRDLISDANPSVRAPSTHIHTANRPAVDYLPVLRSGPFASTVCGTTVLVTINLCQ